MIKEPLKLGGQTPLAQGTHRALFEVPRAPELLVKVMLERPPAEASVTSGKRLKQWLRTRRRYGRFRFLFREYHYYLRAKLEAAETGIKAPVAELRGLIQTDQGIGMLCEKVIGPDGALGPPVSMLHEDGRLLAYLPMLDDFAQRLFDLNLVANDVNDGNVVLGLRGEKEAFVLVDGLGDSHLIPLRTWWPWYNHRSLHKRLHKLAARIDRIWDEGARCFRERQPT